MQGNEREALERLIGHAKPDSGQSRRVANFLLAWWNAESCGGFDLTDLRAVDDSISADMVTVFGLIARTGRHPDDLGYGEDFQSLVESWRPELLAYRRAQDALKEHLEGRDEDYGKIIQAIATRSEPEARAHLASAYPESFSGPKGEAFYAKVRRSILAAMWRSAS